MQPEQAARGLPNHGEVEAVLRRQRALVDRAVVADLEGQLTGIVVLLIGADLDRGGERELAGGRAGGHRTFASEADEETTRAEEPERPPARGRRGEGPGEIVEALG